MTNTFQHLTPKFQYGRTFGLLFFTMIGLMLFSTVYLVNSGRLILDQAKQQRALMNKHQLIVDELLFTATQIQDMMTPGLLSDSYDFKQRQKEYYDKSMADNTNRLNALDSLGVGNEHEQAFGYMLAARNANTEVREQIIALCLAGSEQAVGLFNEKQRALNQAWLNSISMYGEVVRSYNDTTLSELQKKADRLIKLVALSFLAIGIMLLLLAIQVFVNGRKMVRLFAENQSVIEALDRSMLVNKVDKEGAITSANQNLCRITGYTEQELIGKNPRIFNSGYHDRQFWEELWSTVSKGKVWHGNIRNKGKHGSMVWMNTVIVPFLGQNEEIVEYLVFRTDVSEAIDLKGKLTESEEMNRSILDSVDEQMAVINASGILISVNGVWSGLPEEYRTCLHESELGIDYLSNRRSSAEKGRVPCKLFLNALNKLNEGGSKEESFEFEAPLEIGHFWFSATLRKIVGGKGDLLLIVRDVTTKKHAELTIRHAKESLEIEVSERTSELLEAKEILEVRNHDITSSIQYASRITDAILPSLRKLRAHFPDHFVISKPVDIIGGDFVWWGEKNGLTAIAAVDCTGHGVPGSLMSIISSQLLNDTMNRMDWRNPGMMLSELNQQLIQLLEISVEKQQIADGMDIALCIIDKPNNRIYTAGAYRPVYYTDKDGVLNEIRGNVFSIGGGSSAYEKSFKSHQVDVTHDMMVYFGSDGYQSQFGGPEDKKFGKRKFREMLQDVSSPNNSLQEQKTILSSTFNEWKGAAPQTDDVLLIGLKLRGS